MNWCKLTINSVDLERLVCESDDCAQRESMS